MLFLTHNYFTELFLPLGFSKLKIIRSYLFFINKMIYEQYPRWNNNGSVCKNRISIWTEDRILVRRNHLLKIKRGINHNYNIIYCSRLYAFILYISHCKYSYNFQIFIASILNIYHGLKYLQTLIISRKSNVFPC